MSGPISPEHSHVCLLHCTYTHGLDTDIEEQGNSSGIAEAPFCWRFRLHDERKGDVITKSIFPPKSRMKADLARLCPLH